MSGVTIRSRFTPRALIPPSRLREALPKGPYLNGLRFAGGNRIGYATRTHDPHGMDGHEAF